jgi:predicted GTPase
MNNLPIYNFVILGKSGIGKSSLINYFFDSEVAKVGQGKPITGKIFEKFSLVKSDLNINIYDSWGIEGGKTNEWINYFNHFLQKTKTDNIYDWIHTAVYCISGESSRIEIFDKEIINILIKEKLNPIIVITKSDLSNPNFKEIINKEFPQVSIVEICSIKKQVGLGSSKKISEPQGLEELTVNIVNNSNKTFEPRFLEIINNLKAKHKNETIKKIEVLLDKEINFHGNIIGKINSDKQKLITNLVNNKIKFEDDLFNIKLNQLKIKAESLYKSLQKMSINNIQASNPEISIKETKVGLTVFSGVMSVGLSATSILSIISVIPILMPFAVGFAFLSSGISKQELKNKIMEEVHNHYRKI